jgi:hypothetical protein
MGANHWHSKTRSRQEYLDSLRDPLVLGFLEKIQTFRYAPTTLAGKRRVVAAFLRWTKLANDQLGKKIRAARMRLDALVARKVTVAARIAVGEAVKEPIVKLRHGTQAPHRHGQDGGLPDRK